MDGEPAVQLERRLRSVGGRNMIFKCGRVGSKRFAVKGTTVGLDCVRPHLDPPRPLGAWRAIPGTWGRLGLTHVALMGVLTAPRVWSGPRGTAALPCVVGHDCVGPHLNPPRPSGRGETSPGRGDAAGLPALHSRVFWRPCGFSQGRGAPRPYLVSSHTVATPRGVASLPRDVGMPRAYPRCTHGCSDGPAGLVRAAGHRGPTLRGRARLCRAPSESAAPLGAWRDFPGTWGRRGLTRVALTGILAALRV